MYKKFAHIYNPITRVRCINAWCLCHRPTASLIYVIVSEHKSLDELQCPTARVIAYRHFKDVQHPYICFPFTVKCVPAMLLYILYIRNAGADRHILVAGVLQNSLFTSETTIPETCTLIACVITSTFTRIVRYKVNLGVVLFNTRSHWDAAYVSGQLS